MTDDPLKSTDAPLLAACGLRKVYGTRHARKADVPPAIDDVSLQIAAGEVVAVVGESGSGKTTLTRCLLGLEQPSAGQVMLNGRLVVGDGAKPDRAFRRTVQAVFQDPMSSLDPRWAVRKSVGESLDYLGAGHRRDQRDALIVQHLERIGLSASLADRRPSELSGGQRQRAAIAAALACAPRLLIADEPVTALDVSIQAQILNLLSDLNRDLGLAILIVSHDLSVVGHLSDRVIVLYEGRVVETGRTDRVLAEPAHAYTRSLLAAVPGQGSLRNHASATRSGPGPAAGTTRHLPTS